MISKELLSEVLKLNITYIERCNNSIIYKISVYDREEEVNIYELAYKCKEWALNKNYTLLSSIEIDCGYCDISFIINNKAKHKLITEASEVEAIFKACQWILDN